MSVCFGVECCYMSKFTLYLDESGSTSFTQKTLTSRGVHFAIGAIAVEHKEDASLSAYFEYLKRKHSLGLIKPFHSYDIFENTTSSQFLTPAKSRLLCASLAEFIEISPIKFNVLYLNREECRKYFKIKKSIESADITKHIHGQTILDLPYDIVSTQVLWWFSNEVLSDHDKGSITAESREMDDHALLDSFIRNKMPDNFSILKPNNKAYRSFEAKLNLKANYMRARVTSLKFENKTAECPGLELADLISYVTFLSLEGRLRQFNNKGLPELWKVIKRKMENKNPTQIEGKKFSESLCRSRVNKISKFVSI